jgi:hypothetical protein
MGFASVDVRETRVWHRQLRWFAIVFVLALLGGCGPMLYTINFVPATRAVEQAREAGAAEHAPYELHYAQAHLDKAREEAAEAAYEDAVRYADVAAEYGTKARDLARRRMREMGR